MRPTRLELEGFTAFKEPIVIDFSDTEYFALVGPTGSGKSTIIDAICFALYGLVPRYESKTLVWPVITQGALEAKVRLDFTVGGEAYTAVRVVKKMGANRANTKEARLEHNGEVLAGTADELSDAVEKLLGLSFEHFTKCVVLPQGEFARFLHDKPAARQEVLVRLLNLSVYDRMRYLASTRASNRKYEVALRRQRIDEDLAFATDEGLREKKATVATLLELRDQVAEMTPKLVLLEQRETKAAAEVEESRSAIAALSELEVPDEIVDLAKRLKAAHAAVAASEKSLTGLKNTTKSLVEERTRLGDVGPLTTALKTFERADSLTTRVKEATADAAAAIAIAEAATKDRTKAENALAAATETADAARRADLAAHLAHGLGKGDPCPVCERPLTGAPKHAARAGLEKAEAKVEEKTAALATATQSVAVAEKRLAEVQGGLTQLEKDLAAVNSDLAGAPARKDIEATLAAIEKADTAIEKARVQEGEATDACDAARASIRSLETERSAATKEFHAARDTVSALKPPAATHDDLAADWAALVKWAKDLLPKLEKAVLAATETIEKIAVEKNALLRTIAEACERCAVDLSEGDPKEAVASTLARAKGDVERIEQGLTDKAKLELEAADLQIEHDVANGLAQHLKADRFERWVVNEALHHLVAGATSILNELSNGQYSLIVDDSGNFLVRDHHNADETRLAKTLSGGETFLASLSLALALADQLADLAVEGSAQLESLFLDEGFGTLDAETLDTVAATVENLAARGRMVGIVTHVRELADRVPVQFRVTKDIRTSTVEKVAS